jgi:hypothetical protein
MVFHIQPEHYWPLAAQIRAFTGKPPNGNQEFSSVTVSSESYTSWNRNCSPAAQQLTTTEKFFSLSPCKTIAQRPLRSRGEKILKKKVD